MTDISVAAQSELVTMVEMHSEYRRPLACGLGICHTDKKGNPLDALFPILSYDTVSDTGAALAFAVRYHGGSSTHTLSSTDIMSVDDLLSRLGGKGPLDPDRSILGQIGSLAFKRAGLKVVATFIGHPDDDIGPQDIPNAYLRLSLFNLGFPRRNLKVGSAEGFLPALAWTSEGPIRLEELPQRRLAATLGGRPLIVHSVNSDPPMRNYVVQQ